MKLVLCIKCEGIFILKRDLRQCHCGKSQGRYLEDNLTAEVSGEHAVPLAFSNDSFIEALRNRPESGMGSNFRAWVIPKQCPTVKNAIRPETTT